jgi:hypothetical protein
MKNTLLNPPSFFLFFALLIETVISKPELILNKFFSIKTKNNYFIFNVDNFLYNEDIYLTIKSKGKCENFIEYQFYDDIEDISIPNVDFKFRTESYLKEKKNYLNDEDGVSLYYAITKRKDILFKKKGNLLYFEFNCGSEVEIINTKERHEQLGLVILYYASLSLLIIIFLIIIKGVICSFIEIKKNSYYIKKNWNKTQNDMRYPKEKIVYVVQDQIINVNENEKNNNINNNLNNINNKDNYQGNDSLDYPDLSQNNSPEVSQSTKILYSTNSNFFTP